MGNTRASRIKVNFVDLSSMSSRDAAIASAEVSVLGQKYESTATSKRDPLDSSDQEIGELIAMGRALEAVGKKMQKRAAGLTKHADDMRAYRNKQLTDREEKVPDSELDRLIKEEEQIQDWEQNGVPKYLMDKMRSRAEEKRKRQRSRAFSVKS